MPTEKFFKLPAEKRNQITKCAIEQFKVHTYQDISVNKLIVALGISTGSFYLYFVDKKDLYFYVLSIFLDDIVEESVKTGTKLDIISSFEKNMLGSRVIEKFHNDPLHQAVFNDNFNNAPINIKRDWDFETLIKKYINIYDYEFFQNDWIKDECKENKEVIMAMVIAIKSIVEEFTPYSQDFERYQSLFKLCLNVIHDGIKKQ